MKNKKNNKGKKKSNIKFSIKIFRNLFLYILFIFAITMFFLSPLFDIIDIKVSGNNKVSTTTIINLSGLVSGENIFKFLKVKTNENIKENRYIENVKIKRELPSIVHIQINERIPKFLLEFANSFVYIDKQGYLLEIIEEKIDIPIIVGYSTFIDGMQLEKRLNKQDLKALQDILDIENAMKYNEINNIIDKIDITNSKIVLYMSDEKIVYFEDISDLNIKMLYLKKILEEESGIAGEIFLGDKIFFKEKV